MLPVLHDQFFGAANFKRRSSKNHDIIMENICLKQRFGFEFTRNLHSIGAWILISIAYWYTDSDLERFKMRQTTP
jgi:hypothetical protein